MLGPLGLVVPQETQPYSSSFSWCRILVWMSPLSAPWWELTAQRPSSSWLFTAAV